MHVDISLLGGFAVVVDGRSRQRELKALDAAGIRRRSSEAPAGESK